MASHAVTPSGAGHLEALESVALEDSARRVERVLETAREALDMDVAYFSEFTHDEQVIERVHGDSSSFGFEEGTAVALEETYCRRMVAGEIPNVIGDTRRHPGVMHLEATADAGLGAYIGVPLQLSDGRVFGTFCCASHRAHEQLGERDVRFMRVLARLLADQLEASTRLPERSATPAAPDDAVARLSLWFAGAPRAAPAARQALASLEEHVSPGCMQELNLLVTELVTNSVRHAGVGPASAVGLEVLVRPGCIRAVVSDPGPGFTPAVRDPDPLSEGGRGLFIVDQLAARWGVETAGGTRVWVELEER